jgi:hypothetical protein
MPRALVSRSKTTPEICFSQFHSGISPEGRNA